MKQKITVLIALDYSSTSHLIARIGYKIASAMNANIILLHVINDTKFSSLSTHNSVIGDSSPSFEFQQTPENVSTFEHVITNFLDKIKFELHDESIEIVIGNGETVSTILEFTNKYKVDIIMIGSHTHSAFVEMLVSSNTFRLIRDSETPIFLIPFRKT